MQRFIPPYVSLFYAAGWTFFCLSSPKYRILSLLNRLKNRGFNLFFSENCAKPLNSMVKMALFNKSTECFLTIKIQNIYTTSRTGFCSMKRNAKTIVAGIVALAMSHAAMAKDIKVAVVGAMSGPVARRERKSYPLIEAPLTRA
ncbi:hypothetical protein ACLBO4_27040, partial [Klebsiella pneumoniae]